MTAGNAIIAMTVNSLLSGHNIIAEFVNNQKIVAAKCIPSKDLALYMSLGPQMKDLLTEYVDHLSDDPEAQGLVSKIRAALKDLTEK